MEQLDEPSTLKVGLGESLLSSSSHVMSRDWETGAGDERGGFPSMGSNGTSIR